MTDRPGEEHDAIPRPARRPGRGRYATAARAKNRQHASRWVLAIALMQIAFGAWFGATASKDADAALRRLDSFPQDQPVAVEGQTFAIPELRQRIERERLQAFVLPIGLGVVFLGLWVWSRKSPLPALGTALGLFVTVHAVEAALDPTSLLRGVIVKAFCIAGLGRGLKSALEERTLLAEDDAPGS